jgi:two-component system, NtrC family, sensor histidine kinase HydH
MADRRRTPITRTDVMWLLFVFLLAILPPLNEWHKELILAGIALFQIFEGRILGRLSAGRRNFLSILVKMALSTLLVWHSGMVFSSYYPIYYLPVISAAMLYGVVGTLLWTLLACASYSAFLIPALQRYYFTAANGAELSMRLLFFFIVGIIVNRFVIESREQARRREQLAVTLLETNRQLEQAQADARRSERLAALGQLSAGLAHEIRNPLGVIRGSAEMLNQKLHSADPITSELAGYISNEVERLNRLVARFLDFARPLQPKVEKQPIKPIVDLALKSVQEQQPDAKVQVEWQETSNLPAVIVDSELIERVFTNLFSNAYEAMPEGGLLRVKMKPAVSDGRGGVEVEVSDTGPGVPVEEQEHIFNPFFTTKKSGLGLGLSMVSRIVDDHRGRIRLESQSGKGACFCVFLPGE